MDDRSLADSSLSEARSIELTDGERANLDDEIAHAVDLVAELA